MTQNYDMTPPSYALAMAPKKPSPWLDTMKARRLADRCFGFCSGMSVKNNDADFGKNG